MNKLVTKNINLVFKDLFQAKQLSKRALVADVEIDMNQQRMQRESTPFRIIGQYQIAVQWIQNVLDTKKHKVFISHLSKLQKNLDNLSVSIKNLNEQGIAIPSPFVILGGSVSIHDLLDVISRSLSRIENAISVKHENKRDTIIDRYV